MPFPQKFRAYSSFHIVCNVFGCYTVLKYVRKKFRLKNHLGDFYNLFAIWYVFSGVKDADMNLNRFCQKSSTERFCARKLKRIYICINSKL